MKEGWVIKKLGDVCDLIGGGTPSKGNINFYDGKIFWATVRDMKGDFINETEHKITDAAVKQSSTNIIPKGNVIIATRVGLGKVCLVENDTAINQDLKGIIPKRKTDLSVGYLFRWLKSISQQIIEEGTGATVQGVKLPFIKGLEIPLPPLPEQQRIVSILDKAFTAIDKAKAIAEINLKNAKELFESYLQGVFEKPKENWEVCNLETYIKLIDYRGRTPVKTESGVRLITAKNVKLGYLQIEPQEFIAEGNYESWMSRGIPNFGDVIFTTEAPLANVAQIDTTEKLAFAQRIIVMQPKPSKINQTFLKYMLLSNPIRNKILGKGTGATVLGIKSSLLKKIEIYFPKSIEEQQNTFQKLEALSAETKRLEAIYQQKINDLDELKKSILQKAFSGELNREVEFDNKQILSQ
jgi:type I restriction enzyme S subunit